MTKRSYAENYFTMRNRKNEYTSVVNQVGKFLVIIIIFYISQRISVFRMKMAIFYSLKTVIFLKIRPLWPNVHEIRHPKNADPLRNLKNDYDNEKLPNLIDNVSVLIFSISNCKIIFNIRSFCHLYRPSRYLILVNFDPD